MIKFNEKFTVSVDATNVDERGQERIRGMLIRCSLPPLPSDWEWSRCIREGDLRGNIPKRVATYYKRAHKKKISLDLITSIGNQVNHYSFGGKTYTLDLTEKIDWNADDFGDYGSCFWGCRELAREALMENGVIAVRFYRESGSGYARAFVIRAKDSLVIFNAYGLPCRTIAYVLATFFDYPYRKEIDLCIRGDRDGLIWLNEDAHQIGQEPLTDRVTVRFDVPYAWCRSCDEFYPVEQGEYIDDNGFVCNNC